MWPSRSRAVGLVAEFFFSSLPSPYHYTDECSDPTTTADPVLLAVRACTALRLALHLRADEALEGGGEA